MAALSNIDIGLGLRPTLLSVPHLVRFWFRYFCSYGSANERRLIVYRVLTYVCFAFVIKYTYINRREYVHKCVSIRTVCHSRVL